MARCLLTNTALPIMLLSGAVGLFIMPSAGGQTPAANAATPAQTLATMAAPARPALPAAARMVFAHYMVCFATYGESLEGYKREIRQAQAAGIDGFVLNVGAWSREQHYQRRTEMIYQAAQELGDGFRLFFSVNMSDVPDILDMIKTYGKHPNQFTYQGRIVVSTFSQEGLDWKRKVLTPLKEAGFGVFFVPYFYPRPKVTELPDYKTVVELYQRHAGTVDGMFYFGAAGTSEQLAAANAAYARAIKEAGRVYMASYCPNYWGFRQPPGRRYFETDGGEGTGRQWKSIIAGRPDWVEIVTWNDFNESTYVCPVEDPGEYLAELRSPKRSSHAGYLELSRHYIAWYKTGAEPPIKRDCLFYFYRTHPKDAKAAGDDKAVRELHGDVKDVIYLTTMLTAPAEVEVTSGGRKSVHLVPDGVHHMRVPFAPGEQHMEVRREGGSVIAADGPKIEARPAVYNFFPVGGWRFPDRSSSAVPGRPPVKP